MEDRYLFKAKRIDNGEWAEGFPFLVNDVSYILPHHNTGQPIHIDNLLSTSVEVSKSTICQCTGLKDKNGNLIWENDVVKINNSKVNTLITFRDFEIICTIPNEKYYKHRLEYDTEYEVIGNIFDNPELLESEG
jgi:uncharacterized phage protein (TIGR01671 family)|nr:MAG TPA: YopX protein [Caudoviricetes sp.]DAZ01407.1 MAG TPA: YopX protein [Caudoviricetes sp.]